MNYVIVGNGVAAVKAVEGIRSVDAGSTITVLGRESYHAYSPILMTHVIAGDMKAEDVFYRTAYWYEQMNVKFVPDKTITELYPNAKTVSAADGSRWHYDKLLLATGASPRMPKAAGCDLPGVFGVRTLKDALTVRSQLGKTKNAIVLGGGLVGCKVAEAFRKQGVGVTMVVGSTQLMSRSIPAAPACILQRRAEAFGIRLCLGARVIRIIGKSSAEGVLLDSGDTIEGELVIAGKGILPNTGMIDAEQILKRAGFIVDEYMRTSSVDVYAAGDVAESKNILNGESEIFGLWPVAVEQGYVAGLNMAGVRSPSAGALHRNIVSIFGITLASAGFLMPNSTDHHLIVHKNKDRDIYRHMIVNDESRIVGVLMVNDVRGLGTAISHIIRQSKMERTLWALSPGSMLDHQSAQFINPNNRRKSK